MAPTLSTGRGARPDPTARRGKPPLQNRLLIRTLRSPLHRLFDGSTVALRVTGIVTGTMHELPVMYAWETNTALVVYPGRPETKTWWRNLRRRTAVSLLHRGRWHQASGEVLQPGAYGYDGAVRAYHRRWPHVRMSVDPLVRLRLIEAEPDHLPGGDTSRVSRQHVRAGARGQRPGSAAKIVRASSRSASSRWVRVQCWRMSTSCRIVRDVSSTRSGDQASTNVSCAWVRPVSIDHDGQVRTVPWPGCAEVLARVGD